MQNIDYMELNDYYMVQNHTKDLTCEKFNISYGKLNKYIELYSMHKTRKQITLAAITTFKEKYGVSNPSLLLGVKDQKRDTNLAKLGVENPSLAQSIKDKKKLKELQNLESDKDFYKHRQEKTNITKQEKYGSLENYNLHLVNKQKETCLNKYGAAMFQLSIYYLPTKQLYTCDGLLFDSLPELAYYKYNIDHCNDIIRLPVVLYYYYNGKEYSYYPDFMCNGLLVEIKGDHFFKEDGTMCNPYDHSLDEKFEAKHLCGLLNNVAFLTYLLYKIYTDYFNMYYDKEFFKVNKNE